MAGFGLRGATGCRHECALDPRLLGFVLASNLSVGVFMLANLISRVRLKYSPAFAATWVYGADVLTTVHFPDSGNRAIFLDGMVGNIHFFHLESSPEISENCKQAL